MEEEKVEKKETDLEKTKEFVPVSSKEETPISDDYSKEEASLAELMENMEKEDQLEQVPPKEEKEPEQELTPPKKKGLIIVLGVAVVLVLIMAVIVFFLFFSKDKKEDRDTHEEDSNSETTELSEEEIFQAYVKKLETLASGYVTQAVAVPSYQELVPYIKLEDHTVTCEEAAVYQTGKVYLSNCSVDGSSEKRSYGEKEEEKKVTGKTLTVYKVKNQYGESYQFEKDPDGKNTEVGKIECEGEECTGWYAFSQYAIIEENEKISIYDYQNNASVFGPASYEWYETISSDSTLYGIYVAEKNTNYLYSLATKKRISNIEGEYFGDEMYNNVYQALSLGYATFLTKNKSNVFDVKTGKLAFSVPGKIASYETDGNGKLYVVVSTEKDTVKIYNQQGKAMFNGEEVDGFFVNKKAFITHVQNQFKYYNTSQTLQYTSKTYDDVLMIIDDYVVVVDNNQLQLVDYLGNVIHTFISNWDTNQYTLHTMLSGWYDGRGKNGVYLVIQDDQVTPDEVKRENSDMSLEELKEYDLGYEYYYIPSTKESGKIPTYIGGYAKPVLYLYPTLPTVVNVTFQYPERLTTTYPKYQNQWSVLAIPNGTLFDQKQKSYYALYWEEQGNHYVDFEEGFYVTAENAIDFLEEKLSIIGLNSREQNEFIMYWLPILEKNGQSLVYFELTDERNAYSPIKINPQPDSLLRMAIHIKKVDSYQAIKPQRLKPFQRKGFTAVEWGGVIY